MSRKKDRNCWRKRKCSGHVHYRKSLTLTVGASEATNRDGDTDTLAVGLKTANVEPALHLAEKPVVEAKREKKGVKI